jgi:molecular chaperone DnaK
MSDTFDKHLGLIMPASKSFSTSTNEIRVIGIDLGTTNSTVAEIVYKPGLKSLTVQCLEIEQPTLIGKYTHIMVPSMVLILPDKVLVGEGAKRSYAKASELNLEQDKNIFLECKNEIGTERSYHRAPVGFKSPKEISGHVLAFLSQAAKSHGLPIGRTVITVPASFQVAQRKDTIDAASLAGIELSSGDLLDEPVAAFIDYLLSTSEHIAEITAKPSNILIFDFGGGTCDVAIFHLEPNINHDSLGITPLFVSRYHRLGGGDIDRAILYEVLLPQLMEQNNMSAFELNFEDKKKYVEPALISVAESLKIGLCNELSRLEAFGQQVDQSGGGFEKIYPGIHSCKIRDRAFSLQSPRLSLLQFNNILERFLDHDLLYARETEYYMTCSIFAPIQDALDKSGLTPDNINYCLMVGGSSLIPQVISAVRQYFKRGNIIMHQDRESTQVAVARGAAYHALIRELYKRGIFTDILHEDISIRTNSGLYTLIKSDSNIPYPSNDKWAENSDLALPRTSITEPFDLRVELVQGKEERIIFNVSWTIPPPVKKGDRLLLKYHMDENKVLELKLIREVRARMGMASQLDFRIENPITNVVNPSSIRLKIRKAEEILKQGLVPPQELATQIATIATDYAEIHQHEKAISYLKQALKLKNRPDSNILNLLGIYSGVIGDEKREEKYYRESAESGGDPNSYFNLALLYRKRNNWKEAEVAIAKYLNRYLNGPGLTLKALIAEAQGQDTLRDTLINDALTAFGPIASVSEWELGWMQIAVNKVGDLELAQKIIEERHKRLTGSSQEEIGGELPDIAERLINT